MTEYEIFISNIKKLRIYFGLNKREIEDLLGFSENKYLRIENGEQEPILSDIIEIANLYGLTGFQLLNINLKVPNLSSLPDRLRKAAKERIGKSVRDQSKLNLTDNIIIILGQYYKEYQTFTNSEIIAKLPDDLRSHMKGKSIEWNKGTLRGLVIDTKDTYQSLPDKKAEKIYQLVKTITSDMIEKALEKVKKSRYRKNGKE